MITRAKALLGTYVEISADGATAGKAIAMAFAEVETIQHLMSFHAAESQISRLNCGEEFEPDWRLKQVLQFAENMKQVSGGLFDIAIAQVLVAAGILPNHGYKPQIDLGGIAKGYAVDRAVEVLQEHGIINGRVNAGGDLRLFGEKQELNIRHHRDASLSYPLGGFTDIAIASSSPVYDNNPLVSPLEAKRIDWDYGVTILAPSCMAADALTKITRLDANRAIEILDQFEATAIITDNEGIKLLTKSQQNHAAA